MSPIVTLLTDFGTVDGYVAELKGVLLSLVPDLRVVDLTHDIPPGDIRAGAYALGRAWRSFPGGTVHLAVVDPGVGTARRALAAEVGGQRFVAPDNGLLSRVFEGRQFRALAIAVSADAAPTFHGRDVFAPAAATLARGETLEAEVIADPVRLPAARLQRRGSQLLGEVVHVDRFGTLVSNIPAERLAEQAVVRVGAYELPLRRTFGDVAPGDPVAFIGSGGTVEVAVREGRADAVLGASRGVEVGATVRPAPPPRPSTPEA
jgi:hypothetical protein